MISMKIKNLRKTFLWCVSQCVRDAGVPTKVFGGSETQKCVLIGTSATNIVNISAHHTIFGIFHQLALCFLFSVWFSTGRSARVGPG